MSQAFLWSDNIPDYGYYYIRNGSDSATKRPAVIFVDKSGMEKVLDIQNAVIIEDLSALMFAGPVVLSPFCIKNGKESAK